MREARESLSRQLQELDPDLLVELTVGLRGPGRREADWHDSWRDAFNDNGHFEDLWIDLSSLPEARSAPQDPESGAVG